MNIRYLVLVILVLMVLVFSAVIMLTPFTESEVTIIDESGGNAEEKSDWRLVWEDDFKSDDLSEVSWSLLDASYSNNEQSFYSLDNVIVSDGNLLIKAEKKDNPDNKPYVSGAITSKGKFSQTYGKFEMRAKLPTGQGYWSAFWLMPDDMTKYGTWSACGEIDIMESAGDNDSYAGTLHFGGLNNQWAGKGIGSVKLPNNGLNKDFHVYSVEWEPTEIRWYCDDVLMGKVDNWSTYGADGQTKKPFPAPFDRDFYIILNLAVGGNFTGNKLPIEGNETGEMIVDYVKVYKKDSYVMPEPEQIEEEPDTQYSVVENLLENSSFDSNDNLWNTDGAWEIESPIIENNELKVNILKNVNEQHLQSIKYSNYLDMQKGTRYRLSFKARSTVACKHIRPVIDRPSAGWAKIFLYDSINIGTEMKDYSIEFVAPDSDSQSRLLFYSGLMDGDVGGGQHTIYFDDIKLESLVEN